MTTIPWGFAILGATWERRWPVNAGRALLLFASCDDRAKLDSEAYLSAFQFGVEFKHLLDTTGSTAGYTGPCWAPWLWFDIDRESDLAAALDDARRLASFLLARYRALDDDDLLLFHSGSKGFHVGLPTALWRPEPSPMFHRTAQRFCEALAAAAGVVIDGGIYDRVRAFRAPNSRHPKTGRHKRRLSHEELMQLSLDGILQLAAAPAPFDLPTPAGTDDQAAQDWRDAVQLVQQESEGKAQRRAAVANGMPTLNRSTLDFLRDGADQGDRHRMLFSAAANLAEFGCSFELAYALLSEAALDSGLPPKDVRRQIECGLAHAANAGRPVAESATPSAPAAPERPAVDPAAVQAQLAALWASAEAVADDDAAERAAIQWEGSGQAPAVEPVTQPKPLPPAGAKFHFTDAAGRPCAAAAAHRWTWDGAPAWYAVAECPVPIGRLPGGTG